VYFEVVSRQINTASHAGTFRPGSGKKCYLLAEFFFHAGSRWLSVPVRVDGLSGGCPDFK
jgi:hypothetical protein